MCFGHIRRLRQSNKILEKHKIKKYYFSYQQMVNNEKVDLIYIATLNRDHKICALMCIEINTHFFRKAIWNE